MKISSLISKPINLIARKYFPVWYAKSIGVKVGVGCRILDVNFGSEPWLIEIGDHVSMTSVTFVTHDGAVWVFRDTMPSAEVVAPIKVGSNVFIGLGATIMPGVTIGDNVIIGARSLVNKDVVSGSVVAGVPARVISTLNDYKARVASKSRGTRSLSAREKRMFYTGLYMIKK